MCYMYIFELTTVTFCISVPQLCTYVRKFPRPQALPFQSRKTARGEVPGIFTHVQNWCMLEGSGEEPTVNRAEDPITSACHITQTTPPTHLEFRVEALFMGLSLRQISLNQVSKVLIHLSTT